MIVGWHVQTSKETSLVMTCLKMALWRRGQEGHAVGEGLIHHSDAGSQYTSIRFTDRLVIEGLAASIGTVGDAYDNALAKCLIGIYKTECVPPGPFHERPFKTVDDVEYATFEWVDWLNQRRLHGTLGMIPPADFETNYYSKTKDPSTEMVTT
jgi:putative transposase